MNVTKNTLWDFNEQIQYFTLTQYTELWQFSTSILKKKKKKNMHHNYLVPTHSAASDVALIYLIIKWSLLHGLNVH